MALTCAVVACVGGGSNAIGMFHPFTQDEGVAIYGAEADGDSTQGSATLARGSPGVLHGTRTYLLQDEETGQVQATHSISAGLDYPGVGPEHAFLMDRDGRPTSRSTTTKLFGLSKSASTKASFPPWNLDVALAMKVADLGKGKNVVVTSAAAATRT